MEIDMNDSQNLNADAIYAAMAFLRDYAESPEGREAFKTHLEAEGVSPEETEAGFLSPPIVHATDELKEEIYPGEPISVQVGIDFARNVIWGSPDFGVAILQGAFSEIKQRAHSEKEKITEAMRRFIADRAN